MAINVYTPNERNVEWNAEMIRQGSMKKLANDLSIQRSWKQTTSRTNGTNEVHHNFDGVCLSKGQLSCS